MEQTPVLKVEDLETTFFTKLGPVKAVNSVSYFIQPKETLGIVGESGCGKSVTSLSVMQLLDHPGKITQGSIYLNNLNLLELNEKEMQKIRGNHIAMIFQEPMTALNPVLTIGKQIDEQILQHQKISIYEAKEKTIEFLHLVGIASPQSRYSSYPHQLSGGMRQRAMIAMALSCQPDLLIADEPTTALDVTIQAQILKLIQELQEQFNMSVQFITHDLAVISEIANRVLVMYAGHLCESGPTNTLFSHPAHPYTKALIYSIPKIGRSLQRLPTIEGTVPTLFELPPGCPFQNRCSLSSSICQTRPKTELVQSNHFVACHHWQSSLEDKKQ